MWCEIEPGISLRQWKHKYQRHIKIIKNYFSFIQSKGILRHKFTRLGREQNCVDFLCKTDELNHFYFSFFQVENGCIAGHREGDVSLRRYDDVVPVILPSTAPIHKSSIVEGGGSKQAPVPRGTSPMGAKILKKIRNKVQQRATPNASAAESGMVTETFFLVHSLSQAR